MIPISRRSSRKGLEVALLSCSRQSLPRPARLYSTATKRASAPALATVNPPPVHDFATFMPQAQGVRHSDDIQSFLKRRVPYTLLPTPLPDDRTSALNDMYFPDSPTQDLMAVMDACLYNSYDVPRAKYVFERLRATRAGDPILEPRVYNSFLEAYLHMATEKEVRNRDFWVEDAWALFEQMESGAEKVVPNSGTYSIMLLTWLRFNPESTDPVLGATERTPASLLRCIMDRQIPLSMVASNKMYSSEEGAQVIKLLSRAAVEMGLSRVITELGQVEIIGADPLENVPEVNPVTRFKARHADVDLKYAEDGTLSEVTEVEESSEVEIPFNIDNLRKHLANVAYARRVLPDDAAARQKLLESSVYDVAVQRLRHQVEIREGLGLSDQHRLKEAQLQKWMYLWHEKLQSRLKAEIAAIIQEESRIPSNSPKNSRLGPFLSLLKPEKMSLITILELMRLQGTGGITEGMKTARALLTVGRAIELEYKAESLKKHNIQVPQSPIRPHEKNYFSKKAYQELQNWRTTAQQYSEDAVDWTSDWTQVVRARIGSFLVDCVMDVATVSRTAIDKRTGEKVVEEQPAFFHSYEYLRGHKLGVIRLNSAVAERLSRDGLRETLHPRHLPMLVPPKPWLSHDEGGYLYNKTSAMRFKDVQEQLTYLRHASALGHVELVYAGLDVLGSTPWKINKAIFDVVLQVWNSGERFGKIPSATFDKPEPVKPENYDTDQSAKTTYLNKQRAYHQAKANAHSDRCSVNYKIEIARAFIGDVMYQPHNLDFRGRAYPIPPHLNHLGDDLSRGLLTFAETRPLGKSGLRWLKIHLANLYGFDKGSFDERVDFVHDHMHDIYDSAEKPLDGRQWWRKADDPWQCLASCIELSNALKSGDPLSFASSIPVHQDGTCNGLQHYAALGGDDQGAQQVNLSATNRPSDVYTHVAEMVEKKLATDAAKGNKHAQMLIGKIARKVVKQTVMTTVYGVTFVGARAQIEKQLKDRGDIPLEDCWSASAYLAKETMACIGDLFSGARDIQNWLTLSARLISKSIPSSRLDNLTLRAPDTPGSKQGPASSTLTVKRLPKEQMTSVVWTTPLGLPIVQPYRKTKRKQIMTSLQSVYISDPNLPSEVNAMKQASAFPPNFIHSLDATHMMLTALECRTNNLTFASVHDSYWTHASTIDKMSEIIRDTFIALHSSDVLGKLQKEFNERYKDYKVPAITLRNTSLVKSLKSHGVVIGIPAGTDEAVADETATIDGDDGEDTLLVDPTASVIESEVKKDDDVEVAQNLLVNKKPFRGRKPKNDFGREGDETAIIDEFVNLTELLPPLPQKGDFDVKTIKQSLYFFS